MIEFPCGCKFETNEHGRPIFDPNINNLPLNCERTWDMICEGNTKGVFQLESQLGQSKAKQVKPRSIEELSDLIAIIRPGTSDVIVDGKSLTQHYIDRKAKKDEVKVEYEELWPILKKTQGIMVFQEQAMQIAQVVAGFDLQQADTLRKAIGKKKVDLMAKVKVDFIEGAKKLGKFTQEQAEEIFSWIEASQRYSFNKSHSISYALNGYQTAYAKAHFPRAFFTSYLRHADGKPKPFIEINELVNNARLMDIDVLPPNICRMHEVFKLVDNQPCFGITNIKNVGKSVFTRLESKIKSKKIKVDELTWDQFLMKLGRFIKSNSFEAMIEAGAFDCYNMQRQEMLHSFNIYKELKDKYKKMLSEIDHVVTFKEGLIELIDYIKSTEKETVFKYRNIELIEGLILSLENPPYELKDTASYKAKKERELLGVELTCSEIDDYDILDANCTCREYVKGFNSKYIAIAAKVEDVREYKTKRGKHPGKTMCFLKISDISCMLDNVTVFSDDWEKMKKDILVGEVLLFKGTRDQKYDSFVVNSVRKLKTFI